MPTTSAAALICDNGVLLDDRRYANLGLGLVDGSVIALAEFLGIRRLATRDVRHFAAVRLADGGSFDLVVVPADPDRS